MKTLSDIVVSLPLARELHKRGIVKESINCYSISDDWQQRAEVMSCTEYYAMPTHLAGVFLPAPTTDELLELLPDGIAINGYKAYLVVEYDSVDKFWAAYYLWRDNNNFIREGFPTGEELKEVIAEELIWLDDNKLLEKK